MDPVRIRSAQTRPLLFSPCPTLIFEEHYIDFLLMLLSLIDGNSEPGFNLLSDTE